ncbi:hypothetical protein HNQ51_002810 [Inhella inkyongensis]|uniref:DUF4399 domain-containing protein n=1 Tax=Inhella inkyongensis TaxID=392593 RepID=A0A840SAG8_9BURK|nr:DUF4399 domain-containing protein [Inhella inkyongensis]MBB5205491.1 hypothetical protein [Inhella inkyongensis]
MRALQSLLLCSMALSVSPLWAQNAVPLDAAKHPWSTPAPRGLKAAHFTNISDGARIETPFLLKFGLTGMGLAPITKEQKGTGHHHLLINRELPLDLTQPLPFNDQYIHFGKGQMESVLTLKPGDYTLRLVLADHRHVPHFVYSKPLRVKVTAHHADVPPDSLGQAGVSLWLPKAEVAPGIPVQVLFHASKLNVSHHALQSTGTGHFRLTLKDGAGRSESMDFREGQTEAWLKPPRGQYQLRVDFMDNVEPGRVLHSSSPVTLKVGA